MAGLPCRTHSLAMASSLYISDHGKIMQGNIFFNESGTVFCIQIAMEEFLEPHTSLLAGRRLKRSVVCICTHKNSTSWSLYNIEKARIQEMYLRTCFPAFPSLVS